MFLELAEALDCPRCRDGYGLVTFVTRAHLRRVLEGHLGCPMCEVEFPIVDGTVRFGPAAAEASESAPRPTGGPPDRTGPEAGPSDRETPGPPWGPGPEGPVRIAALLGLTEGVGGVILLGPGPGALGVAVAELAGSAGSAGRIEILAWLDDGTRQSWGVDELARGVNPVLGADPARWPVRAGALDGVALASPADASIEEAVRTLRPEGRLVLLDSDDEALEGLSSLALDELASDASAWVGRRR